MKKKIVAIIQARMGSSRLPGKVLKDLMGKPVLWHIHDRLNRVEAISEVCIATSYLKRDDPIETFCIDHNISIFRGNDADVLDRFYKAALEYKAFFILRVSGDCPLVDSLLIGQMIEYFLRKKLHYCSVATGSELDSNEYYGKYPDGLDAEIFSFNALEKAWKEADGILYREHVTPYFWKYPKKFRTASFMSSEKNYSEHRLTIDSEEDYEIIHSVYETLYPQKPRFNMRDVFELMEKQPEIFRNRNREYPYQM